VEASAAESAARTEAGVKAGLVPLSLRSNFLWTFAGNMVFAACQWGILSAFAKLGSPEQVGRFALGLAITTPLFSMTNLNLRPIQATDSRGDYRFGDYFGLRLVSFGVAVAAVLVVGALAGYSPEILTALFGVTAMKICDGCSDVIYGRLQQKEQMRFIALAMLLRGPLLLGAGAGLMAWFGSVGVAAFGMAAVWAVTIALADIPALARVESAGAAAGALAPRFSWPTLGRLALLALPLAIAYMLVMLHPNVPRYFLERISGEKDLGIFAALAYLTVVGLHIVGALGTAAAPRLARFYANGEMRRFRALVATMAALGGALGLCGVLVAAAAGPWILTLAYGAEYAAHNRLFVWVMVSGGLLYVGNFLGFALTATRRFQHMLWPNILLTVAAFAASWLLIPSRGLTGAAWVLIVVSGGKVVLYSCLVLFLMRRNGWPARPPSAQVSRGADERGE